MEIKIRAWDDYNKHMSYGRPEQYDDSINFRFDHFDTEKPIYMLFTGKKDCNGKELYFGDIVEVWWYRRDDFEKWDIRQYSDLFDLMHSIMESGAKFEIVGNVYENIESTE